MVSRLVDDRTARTGIAVDLVSVDASPPGLPKGATSAVSVTYAFFGGPIEYYDGAQVFLVGAKKVSDIASAILSAVEKRATKLSGQAENWQSQPAEGGRSASSSARDSRLDTKDTSADAKAKMDGAVTMIDGHPESRPIRSPRRA